MSLFVSEVLSTQIRKCKEIEGFRLPRGGGLQFIISQCADDETNFVKNERSLHNLLKVVHKYELGSGAKLNTAKKLKILGVYYSNGLKSVENDNWKSKLDKLQSVLNLWSSRELSFMGRSMILNVLGASRFWHVAKIIPPPSWVVDSYKSIVWPFIWKGKMEPVSRQRCCARFTWWLEYYQMIYLVRISISSYLHYLLVHRSVLVFGALLSAAPLTGGLWCGTSLG